ncbi:hypothetical protein [Ligilactobacillus animalis]|uniref:hypothetical protein n=1 Tax=Ligilactobacillus animalis TaxID=1605 RepID=UPI00384DF94B
MIGIKNLTKQKSRDILRQKKVYEAKIAKLKKDLAILKNKGNLEIQKLLNMIDDVLNVIADEDCRVRNVTYRGLT